jgi:acetoacetyl-CoA reductase
MARVAFVTGGTRGIGAAICIALKNAGYGVAANYAANTDAARTFSEDTGVPTFAWDVGDFDACAAGIRSVEQSLGPIEILINNAGITRDAMLHKMTRSDWRDVLRTDLDSAFNMCCQVIDGMRERNYGRIINITSINGQKGQAGQTNYSAAKAGLIGFTKALALETAKKGITVNAVAPGYIDTEMLQGVRSDVLDSIIATIPVGRLGKAEEVARICAFLAGDDAAFITGATFTVNGAQYIAG